MQQRYTVFGGRRGTVKHCWELLTDGDGFQARCLVPWGTEHSHHDVSAREAVAQRLAQRRDRCYEPAQPCLPATEGVRQVELETPRFELPFALTAETAATPPARPRRLFEEEEP